MPDGCLLSGVILLPSLSGWDVQPIAEPVYSGGLSDLSSRLVLPGKLVLRGLRNVRLSGRVLLPGEFQCCHCLWIRHVQQSRQPNVIGGVSDVHVTRTDHGRNILYTLWTFQCVLCLGDFLSEYHPLLGIFGRNWLCIRRQLQWDVRFRVRSRIGAMSYGCLVFVRQH